MLEDGKLAVAPAVHEKVQLRRVRMLRRPSVYIVRMDVVNVFEDRDAQAAGVEHRHDTLPRVHEDRRGAVGRRRDPAASPDGRERVEDERRVLLGDGDVADARAVWAACRRERERDQTS